MLETEIVKLSAFDYSLPEGLIARYPLANRTDSRMLVLDRKTGHIEHRQFSDFPNYCQPGDALVLNNAKVLPVRLIGHREGFTGEVEIFLLHPQNEARTEWLALTRPSKKLTTGTRVLFPNSSLLVTILEQATEGKARVSLSWEQAQSLDMILETTGQMPLPPYLQRNAEASDTERYQTVFAKTPGAQAAPTAGLHFSQAMLETLNTQGVSIAELSLLVSAGTFRPVQTDNIGDHQMSPEYYSLSEQSAEWINAAKTQSKRVIAVGTTSLKTLESIATKHAGKLRAESDWSDLFITPGFTFQVADRLLTNFHLPKSTLLMLVSAFATRETILKAYTEAIEEQYRFYSYGDCMLII